MYPSKLDSNLHVPRSQLQQPCEEPVVGAIVGVVTIGVVGGGVDTGGDEPQ